MASTHILVQRKDTSYCFLWNQTIEDNCNNIKSNLQETCFIHFHTFFFISSRTSLAKVNNYILFIKDDRAWSKKHHQRHVIGMQHFDRITSEINWSSYAHLFSHRKRAQFVLYIDHVKPKTNLFPLLLCMGRKEYLSSIFILTKKFYQKKKMVGNHAYT